MNPNSLMAFIVAVLVLIQILAFILVRKRVTSIDRLYLGFAIGIFLWSILHGLSYLLSNTIAIGLFTIGSILGNIGVYCLILFLELIAHPRFRSWLFVIATMVLGGVVYLHLFDSPIADVFADYTVYYSSSLQRLSVTVLLGLTALQIANVIVSYFRTDTGPHRKVGYAFAGSLLLGLVLSVLTIGFRLDFIPESDKLPTLILGTILTILLIARPIAPHLVAQKISTVAIIQSSSGLPLVATGSEGYDTLIAIGGLLSLVTRTLRSAVGQEAPTEFLVSGKKSELILKSSGDELYVLATPRATSVLRQGLEQFMSKVKLAGESLNEEYVTKAYYEAFPFSPPESCGCVIFKDGIASR